MVAHLGASSVGWTAGLKAFQTAVLLDDLMAAHLGASSVGWMAGLKAFQTVVLMDDLMAQSSVAKKVGKMVACLVERMDERMVEKLVCS
jgi:hypothetical protein